MFVLPRGPERAVSRELFALARHLLLLLLLLSLTASEMISSNGLTSVAPRRMTFDFVDRGGKVVWVSYLVVEDSSKISSNEKENYDQDQGRLCIRRASVYTGMVQVSYSMYMIVFVRFCWEWNWKKENERFVVEVFCPGNFYFYKFR